ncbi:hypothetical protein BC940DRAFT_287446 [Gongronella butleri]|nr:hypothetical protein BC940DRAFT_287446 [Gongronella butleri]
MDEEERKKFDHLLMWLSMEKYTSDEALFFKADTPENAPKFPERRRRLLKARHARVMERLVRYHASELQALHKRIGQSIDLALWPDENEPLHQLVSGKAFLDANYDVIRCIMAGIPLSPKLNGQDPVENKMREAKAAEKKQDKLRRLQYKAIIEEKAQAAFDSLFLKQREQRTILRLYQAEELASAAVSRSKNITTPVPRAPQIDFRASSHVSRPPIAAGAPSVLPTPATYSTTPLASRPPTNSAPMTSNSISSHYATYPAHTSQPDTMPFYRPVHHTDVSRDPRRQHQQQKPANVPVFSAKAAPTE